MAAVGRDYEDDGPPGNHKDLMKPSQDPKGGCILKYSAKSVIGNGSFGVVFLAQIEPSGDKVAVKKVLQDRRFKNRELQIMQSVSHPNVVGLKHSFYSKGGSSDDVYLNLVLEYVPETVYRVCRHYYKAKQLMPASLVKLFTYQMCRSLAYVHSYDICHRDIKPQNLLVDPRSGVLKLCDFGSAKKLVRGQANVAYICSRYYRAPELIFGATDYTPKIDVWSAGCVFAEMLLLQPLFRGESAVDQLVEIIKVLGTPTKQQIFLMNPHYKKNSFPNLAGQDWKDVFADAEPEPAAVDLIKRMLVYSPDERISAIEACAHPYFDDLREGKVSLPSGEPLPASLFVFDEGELGGRRDLIEKLMPASAGAGAPVVPPGAAEGPIGAARAGGGGSSSMATAAKPGSSS